MAFGEQAWKEYIGDPGEVPPLPANIDEILAQPCPFWGPEKRIGETHMLVLIPKAVTVGNNPAVPLTLRTFKELLKSSNNKTSLFTHSNGDLLERYGDHPIQNSHWVLMTKNVLPETVDTPYDAQKQLVEAMGYEVPSCLDAAACILLENMRTGTQLFRGMYTRCQEHYYSADIYRQLNTIVAGGFFPGVFKTPSVLSVSNNCEDGDCFGMAGMKKL